MTWETSKAVCCWCTRPLVRQGSGPWWCANPDCAKRQSAWGIRDASGRWRFLPLPRQTTFAESRSRYTLYGGAAGPGKSHASRWLAYGWCMRIPKFRVLLLRQTISQLEQSHLKGLMELEVPEVFGGTFKMNPFPLATFPNGSFIRGGHMEDANSVQQYLSSEYDLIIAEESTQYPPEPLLELTTRARSSNPLVLQAGGAKVWFPTNPGGPSTDVLQLLFMSRDREEIRERWPHLTYQPDDWTFVPATLDDNPYMDPNYEAQLAIVSQGWRYEQLRHGNWDALPGVYFETFNRDRHVREERLVHPHLLSWVMSCDWGYHDWAVVLWAVVFADGHLHIAREAKFRQLTTDEAYLQHVYPGCQALGIAHPFRQGEIRTWASPDMWQRRGQVGETPGESARRIGWPVRPAKTARIPGWLRIQALLRDAPDGKPWLTIDPSCRYLIRSLQTAVADKTDPEDVSPLDDHALEACFEAGTRVLLERGWTPIEHATLQDRAWTRAGWKPITAVFSVGQKPTLRLELSSGAIVTTTPTHRFWTDRGWVEAESLRNNDTLSICHVERQTLLSTSNSMASSSGDTRFRNASRIAATTGRIASMLAMAWKRCTGRSGRPRTARSLLSTTSTTATATQGTTRSRILSAWTLKPMPANTPGHVAMRSARIWTAFGTWLPRDSERCRTVQTCESGIAWGRWLAWMRSRGWTSLARTALERSRPNSTGSGSVIPTAKPPSADQQASISRLACAPSVEPSSDVTATPNVGTAQDYAVRVVDSRPAGTATVYNLTVADAHEYYVEGVLVANCRYMVMSRPAPKYQPPVVRRSEWAEDFETRPAKTWRS